MKRILLSIGMVVALAGSAAAGINTTKGSQSLVFSFEGLSNLGAGTYDVGLTPRVSAPGSSKGIGSAGGIGVRHFIGDGTAVRPGVTLAFFNDSEGEGDDEVKDSGFAFGLNGVLEKFMAPPSARVAPYMGVGAGFGLANAKREVGDNEAKRNAFNFGAVGVLGFVAEIFDGVQLGAEYQGGLVLESGTTEVGDNSVDDSSFDFGISALSFMLSVDLK